MRNRSSSQCPASLATIDRALELGVTLLATAESYGPFRNEILLGKDLDGRREAAIVATKTGLEITDDGQILGLNGRPDYVRSALDRSLRHLGSDHVDLFYMHRVDPQTPIEETIGAMAELVAEGKVRYLGVCEAAAQTIRRAHAFHPLTAVQMEYSLFERGIEHDAVLETLQELEIGLVAYSPLGRGFLSGAIISPDDFAEGDWRRTDPRFQGDNFDRNLDVVREVHHIAADKDVTSSQLGKRSRPVARLTTDSR
ncbi:aldo/keto reductase [Streptomyces sp. NPDC056910]|uniref:aldo/keto reductase n=1 Tax=Streptomyces sp. NPDC056910 TaxID=3345964 RepID=UPI0036CE6798